MQACSDCKPQTIAFFCLLITSTFQLYINGLCIVLHAPFWQKSQSLLQVYSMTLAAVPMYTLEGCPPQEGKGT